MPKIYWGVMLFEKANYTLCYFLEELAKYIKKNYKIIILLADVHTSLLDISITPREMECRVIYYKTVITYACDLLGINTSLIEFRVGSEFQLSKNYNYDLLKLSSLISYNEVISSVSGIIYPSENVSISLYPLMQILDEIYLHCDIQLGGLNQQGIFKLAEKYLPKLNYESKRHIVLNNTEDNILKNSIVYNNILEELTGKLKNNDELTRIFDVINF